MISEKEFSELKQGDRVELYRGTNGTIEGERTRLSFSGVEAVKINQDKKVFSCPYFTKSEIKSLIK